jgi:hypothetical protein
MVNFAFFMVEDKVAAERFRVKNKGKYTKECQREPH